VFVVQLDLEHRPAQHRQDASFNFDVVFHTQLTKSPPAR
jgi:hypothetical protein